MKEPSYYGYCCEVCGSYDVYRVITISSGDDPDEVPDQVIKRIVSCPVCWHERLSEVVDKLKEIY